MGGDCLWMGGEISLALTAIELQQQQQGGGLDVSFISPWQQLQGTPVFRASESLAMCPPLSCAPDFFTHFNRMTVWRQLLNSWVCSEVIAKKTTANVVWKHRFWFMKSEGYLLASLGS